MKVGILTFHFAHNYGAVLQAFSLVNYLRELEIDCEIINYCPKEMAVQYLLSPFSANNLKLFVRKITDFPNRKYQYELFKRFIEKNLTTDSKLFSKSQLVHKCSDFDVIIAGSDQIWNEELTFGDTSYFLPFDLPGVSKVAYAASFGKSTLAELSSEARLALTNFSHISLREDTCLKELSSIVNVPLSHVVDPVFLHDSNYWSKNSSPVPVKSEYCILYMLQRNEMLLQEAINYANNRNICLYAIHPICLRQCKNSDRNDVGPSEFLYLIENAECVFTNSFHGVAFSSIFNKQAEIAIHTTSGSRTSSLLSLFGVVVDKDGVTEVDFSKVDRTQFDELTCTSKRYLTSCLRCEKKD